MIDMIVSGKNEDKCSFRLMNLLHKLLKKYFKLNKDKKEWVVSKLGWATALGLQVGEHDCPSGSQS